MRVTQRAANLKAFRSDPNISVILMSLKSGGEGLNLQAANYVFVLEPWWNPAVEMQAGPGGRGPGAGGQARRSRPPHCARSSVPVYLYTRAASSSLA